jgi:hypothetical protein
MDVTGIATTSQFILYVIKNNKVYKSTNSGFSWGQLYFPSGFSGPPKKIVVAPDSTDIIAVSDNNTQGEKVWVSTNGGSTWSDFGPPQTGPHADITGLDISRLLGNTRYFTAVTADDQPENQYKGSVMTKKTVNSIPSPEWIPKIILHEFDFMAIRACPPKPNYYYVGVVAAKLIISHVFFMLIDIPNGSQMFFKPMFTQLDTKDYSFNSDAIYKADIAFSPDYNLLQPQNSQAFVSVATRTPKPSDGVYRVSNQSCKLQIPNSDPNNNGIMNLDYKNNTLVAGAVTTNKVWKSSNALTANPNNVSWTAANTPPSGQKEVVLRYHGNQVFAGTSGSNSGLSKSADAVNFGLVFAC